jgi:putative two-component system response regulator
MPEMDGFELCRKIRAMPSAKSLPIAFLTARNMQEDFKTGIDAGGNDYIVKPFTANTLLRHVNHWAHRAVALQPG